MFNFPIPVRSLIYKSCPCFFLFFVCTAVFAKSLGSRPIDIAIDLDGVLGDTYSEGMRPTCSGCLKIPEVLKNGDNKEKLYFLVYNDVPLFLQRLAEIPGARISFCSHSPRERLERVLSAITLPDGRTAISLAPGRVFADDRLPKGIPKDLRTVLPDANFDRTILIDDYFGSVAPGQERNFLFFFRRRGGDHTTTYVETLSILRLAIDRSNTKHETLVEAMSHLLWGTPTPIHDQFFARALEERLMQNSPNWAALGRTLLDSGMTTNVSGTAPNTPNLAPCNPLKKLGEGK